ncbi:aminoglycoside phosphotransferase family protein [Promicromonospora citrea]|uniref:Aminoglycoside phosphotransferase domain-containing protein n=2 Tax=Promicromonospora citrea TaxID=43677 RepID=A0A8H9L3E0_9MICO|nr:aminoglycoside phosphotransferase family protein [Promicromonospora citrea]GGM20153.1 hypothetical protein GCM10010102_14820 [Promicromonospora citrea]
MDEMLSEGLAAFQAVPEARAGVLDTRSGAGVHPVRTAAGERAYLKVTPGRSASAERELRFYRHLAADVPVVTPRLLGAASLSAGTALLLSDVGSARPASAWSASDWAALGGALAALHSMPRPAGTRTRPEPLQGVDDEQARAFWSSSLPDVDDLLARQDAIRRRLDAQPAVFVHGDCHTDNVVLRPGGGVAFCDWQSSGVGRASSDLAFLSVRVTPDGVRIPPALLDAYAARRQVDAGALRRAVLLEELATYVSVWPPYAAYNDADGVLRVRKRARELWDELRPVV